MNGWEPSDAPLPEGSVAYHHFEALELGPFAYHFPIVEIILPKRSPSLFKRRHKPDLAELLVDQHWPIEERRLHRQRLLVHVPTYRRSVKYRVDRPLKRISR